MFDSKTQTQDHQAAPMISLLILTLAPALTVTPDGDPPSKPAAVIAAQVARSQVARNLMEPLEIRESDVNHVGALVRRAVEGAVTLGGESEIGRKLQAASGEALAHLDAQPRAAVLLMELTIADAARNLAFEAFIEAPFPAGFPHPVPAGEIQVTEYPEYRRARASQGLGRQNGAFFTLFRHITSNDIAMTAPVEMTVENDRAVDMAFLYGDPNTGKSGAAGRVAVQDVPSMTVVSMGVRGTSEGSAVKAGLAELEAWLARHEGEWKQAGSPRIMGYNSPMVPRNRQFSEVQIPIERIVKPRSADSVYH